MLFQDTAPYGAPVALAGTGFYGKHLATQLGALRGHRTGFPESTRLLYHSLVLPAGGFGSKPSKCRRTIDVCVWFLFLNQNSREAGYFPKAHPLGVGHLDLFWTTFGKPPFGWDMERTIFNGYAPIISP